MPFFVATPAARSGKLQGKDQTYDLFDSFTIFVTWLCLHA